VYHTAFWICFTMSTALLRQMWQKRPKYMKTDCEKRLRRETYWLCVKSDVYNTLQHTATTCIQHTATHCNNKVYWLCVKSDVYNTLQHTATHCNTLQQQSLLTLCQKWCKVMYVYETTLRKDVEKVDREKRRRKETCRLCVIRHSSFAAECW